MSRKYIIIVPDGAADEPLEQFDGKTALEAAHIPNTDKISSNGRQGLVFTVPDDMQPGSDVAQMSLLGYDPRQYYTGRAPIEAVAQNISLDPSDWVFRCNLVTIADGDRVYLAVENITDTDNLECEHANMVLHRL